MWDIQLFKLNFDHRERDAAAAVIDSGWITMGERTKQFETEFQELLGNDAECIAVSSATAALHMGLLAFDVKAGDEVIIPAQTFVADINVVRLVGATPVLADSNSLTDWNVNATTIERCITSKTKAVIIVHFAGFPCDIEEISALCKAREIALIEDTAHAPGASVNGRMCGTFGDVGCFSFFSNKNLSIGEGGMVVSNTPEVAARLRLLRSHGMTAATLDRHKGRAVTYDVAQVGLNYRMDEIRAAIGSVQLEKLPEGNRKRKNLFDRYRANLLESDIVVPFGDSANNKVSAYHIMPILLPEGVDRLQVIAGLKEAGIQSSIHYPPFWGFTAYKDDYTPDDAPVASEICERELTLPLYPDMSEAEVDLVTKTLLKVIS